MFASARTVVLSLSGYNTAKGELVRSILFPKPLDFKFTRDSYKYVGFLAAMALVGMVYTIVVKVIRRYFENGWISIHPFSI